VTYQDDEISANLGVPAGATVYDVSGEKLDKVSGGTAFGDYYRLEKGPFFLQEYYIPKSAISRIDPDGICLTVTRDDVKNSGWDYLPSESVEMPSHVEEP
jgi:hypothetical protein